MNVAAPWVEGNSDSVHAFARGGSRWMIKDGGGATPNLTRLNPQPTDSRVAHHHTRPAAEQKDKG